MEAPIFPDTTDDPIPPGVAVGKVAIQAHDFGGSIPLPHYGHKRPNVDYYQSNLMQHNLVLCDVLAQKHTIKFYDEREQGKGADACNSMRLAYELKILENLRSKGIKPEDEATLIVLMDNCNGQNKSQCVMQFWAMMSLFFKTVVTFYFVRGHTKMIADRIVAL